MFCKIVPFKFHLSYKYSHVLFSVLLGTVLKVNCYCVFKKGFVLCYIFMPEDRFIKAEICSMFWTVDYVV